MGETARKPLGQILLEQGMITEEQLNEALNYQAKEGGALGQILVSLGYIDDADIPLALGEQAGMEVIDLDHIEIEQDVIGLVPASVAQIYRVVPVDLTDGVVVVAMADPMNISILDDLRFLLSLEVQGAVSNEAAVSDAIDKYYGQDSENIDDLIQDMAEIDEMELVDDSDEGADLAQIENMVNLAPVVKLLNLVLLTAIKDQASDIHFEPYEDEFRIRYRVDGVLLETAPPPRQLSLAVTSRIKVMADLNIAERRLPQDGRIMLNVRGNPIDLRVSTLPTMFGESVVLRVLDRSVVSLDLERLGMREDELEYMRDLISQPNGIVLVTGPTGSGKTTTLYSALNEANDVAVKIITTEDPVEYDLEGIIQVQIQEEIGVTYAACLRSILRQDPDKILVGEIRDLETAQIAIEASLTGHLVFSTLHTNDAASTITRLLDMGLEPFLVSATLESVVAQRLVRVICTQCKKQYNPEEENLMELGLMPEDVAAKAFYYGEGCDNCNGTGFRGRNAIFEMLRPNQRIRELIVKQASTEVIRAESMASGMRTLRDAGILKVFDGITTIEEVVRATLAFE